MIEHKHIYASIYIRSLLDQVRSQSYYDKAVIANLVHLEYTFAIEYKDVYDEIMKAALNTWQIIQNDKKDYMVQTAPLITAIYHFSKKELSAAGVPKILFDRIMEKYFAIGDDMYEARSNQLAKEIFSTTQKVLDESNI